MPRDTTVMDRFRALVRRWLATLPPEGWLGSVEELFANLDALRQAGEWQGRRTTEGLRVALAGSGFTVSTVRGSKGRLLRIQRVST